MEDPPRIKEESLSIKRDTEFHPFETFAQETPFYVNAKTWFWFLMRLSVEKTFFPLPHYCNTTGFLGLL